MQSDGYYMDLALQRAREVSETGEVPVGAILVQNGVIYSTQGNAREGTYDPTAHAEVLAIRHASESLQTWRLTNSTLYVTIEPCLLCTGAIYLSRISRVVYGCNNPKGGALRFISKSEKTLQLNHSIEIVGGVREEECSNLISAFFQAKRDTAL